MAWARKTAGGKWGGAYRDAAGAVRYTPAVHTFKTEARAAGTLEEAKARRGQRSDPTGARMKWGAWCDQWWPTRGVEASTEVGNRPYLRHCRARWDTTPVGMISRHDLQAWVRELSRDMAASSVRQAFYLVSASLNAAISHGIIDVNPCGGVELPVPPPATERFLSDVEVDKIFYHLDERWRVLAELLLDTGVRLAEACGLHWERVNLDAGTLTVVEVWQTAGTRAMKAYPKGRRIRTVPLTGAMTDLLVRWRDHHPDTGSCGRPHVVDDSKRARARAREVERVKAGRPARVGSIPTSCRSSLVIAGPQGAPIDPHNFTTRQWSQAVRLAEVADATPHALRHTYASRLLTEDVPIARVSKLLGHASVSTTERYAYLVDDRFDEVRAALQRSSGRDAGRDAATEPTQAQDVSRWRRPRSL